jgi:hypothetical protein
VAQLQKLERKSRVASEGHMNLLLDDILAYMVESNEEMSRDEDDFD